MPRTNLATPGNPPERYSEQATTKWLKANVASSVLLIQLQNLIEGVRRYEFQRGLKGHQPTAKAFGLKITHNAHPSIKPGKTRENIEL